MHKRGRFENVANTTSHHMSPGASTMYQDEDLFLLQIFPEVVWKLILDYLRDPTDLESCSNSSTFFRNRLSSRRTTFLFPKVFQCLAPKYEQDKSKCYKDKITKKMSKVSLHKKVWKFPGNFRLVCSSWNEAVENYFQNHASHFHRDGLGIDSRGCNWRYNRCNKYYQSVDAEDPKSLERFQKISTVTQKNPFWHRSVKLCTESMEISDPNNTAVRFLSTFGKHIWFFRFYIANNHPDLEGFYFCFVKLLKFLPNLKVLRLRYETEYQGTVIYANQLTDYAKQTVFPNFPNLVVLKVYDLSVPILNGMMAQNSHIRKLFIRNVDYSFIFSIEFPNLKKVTLSVNTIQELKQLKELELGSKWKLETFTGILTLEDVADPLPIFQLVQNNWSDTLVDLYLSLSHSICENEGCVLDLTTSYRFSLPKLKKFMISAQSCLSLDFLLSCANTLEAIHVIETNHKDFEFECTLKLNPEIKNKQIVEFVGFENKMKESNIWSKFKKLKWVESDGRKVYRVSK